MAVAQHAGWREGVEWQWHSILGSSGGNVGKVGSGGGSIPAGGCGRVGLVVVGGGGARGIEAKGAGGGEDDSGGSVCIRSGVQC